MILLLRLNKLYLKESYNFELKESYWFKEALIKWYTYSNKTNAIKWIEYGETLGILKITKALKTFKNWKSEITNYH